MKDMVYAFRVIGKTKQGSTKNLIKNIGFEMYQHMVAMGFIKECQTASNTEKLWKITKTGKDQEEFYREPTTAEKENGHFLTGLGI